MKYRVDVSCACFQRTKGVGNGATGVIVEMAFDIHSDDPPQCPSTMFSLAVVMGSGKLTRDHRLPVGLQHQRYRRYQPGM